MSITPTAIMCSAPSRPLSRSFAPARSFQRTLVCGVDESTGAWSIGDAPVGHMTHINGTTGTNGSKRLDPGPSLRGLT